MSHPRVLPGIMCTGVLFRRCFVSGPTIGVRSCTLQSVSHQCRDIGRLQGPGQSSVVITMCGDFCALDLGHHHGFRGPASCHANNAVGVMPSLRPELRSECKPLTREAQRDLLEPLQPAGSNGETYRALSPDPAELSGAVAELKQ